MVLRLLFYDRRRTGALGRALKPDPPQLGLRRGGRLDPSDDLPDAGAYGAIRDFPCRAVFRRLARQT
eukprot:4652423-Alexandrium_andersonii.AAC.1